VLPACSRLALKYRTPVNLLALEFWQGCDARLDFSLFEDNSNVLVTDFSNIISVRLEVRNGPSGGGGIIIQPDAIDVGSLNTGLSLGDWTAGTAQHGSFLLPALDMNQPIPYHILECWITIYSMTTTAGLIVHGAGSFKLHRNRAAAQIVDPDEGNVLVDEFGQPIVDETNTPIVTL
jgi:hypothetical protein